eukprot:CAMPEP_0181038374 /NCGR_PEP_ID=MMETSP1070-20121207/9897_1 /TAXON_ID=265543 /ORGANISM="Minutocellus polymorphus, Strain NH13" /LENGTH=230 /DNA_ID=CAMNT_0023116145 /DNA_START=61 /DNA_END=753 /DNA_ORIENTATION=+
MDHAMDITTVTTTATTAPTSSPLTTKKLEATTFALTAMEIDDSIAMLDTFFDPEESFADLPDDSVDESLLCELESFDDCCADAFSSATAFPEPASFTAAAPLHPSGASCSSSSSSLSSTQGFHSCADLSATEERLAAMMRKSAMSRAQIQQSAAANRASNNVSMTAATNQTPAVHIPPVPAGATLKPQTVIAASGFLTGKRSTLTNALEQSRRQLQQYMAVVNQQSQMQM